VTASRTLGASLQTNYKQGQAALSGGELCVRDLVIWSQALERCDRPASTAAHLGLDDGGQVGAVAVLRLQDRRRLRGQHQALLIVGKQAARVADVDRGLHLRRRSSALGHRHELNASTNPTQVTVLAFKIALRVLARVR